MTGSLRARFGSPDAGARPIWRIRRVQNSVYSVTVGVGVAVAVAIAVAITIAVTLTYLFRAIDRNSRNAPQTPQLPTRKRRVRLL